MEKMPIATIRVEWVKLAARHTGMFLTGDNPDSYRDQAPLPLVSSLPDETTSHPQPFAAGVTKKNINLR